MICRIYVISGCMFKYKYNNKIKREKIHNMYIVAALNIFVSKIITHVLV